jgi:hypothetical protein
MPAVEPGILLVGELHGKRFVGFLTCSYMCPRVSVAPRRWSLYTGASDLD